MERAAAIARVGAFLSLFTLAISGYGAGVTIITHGFNSSVTGWVIPMGDKIAQYPTFPGTNSASYQISVTRNGSVYQVGQSFLDGAAPTNTDSGEIVIALDWSSLSSGSVPTTAIATQVVAAILATNFIPDLGGRALAELPLHLVGHSRGASVITEMARLLGAQGIWVDHVTTLDPHPESLFGDPGMKNYANILFADNYWQNMGDGLFVPNGQNIPGAYNRQLTSLNGGYGSSHSDTHLWYHGTIDLHTPISVDSAMITSVERPSWWTATEAAGTNAGILYSLVGRGNRFSTLEPAGAGKGRIVDGYNKVWDLGAGVAFNPNTNRAALPFDNGAWPNLLRLNVTGGSVYASGEAIPLSFYYQFGNGTAAVAAVQFYLDADANPYNGNEILLAAGQLSGTGTNSVAHGNANVTPQAEEIFPGSYYVFARITDGTHSRYLYTTDRVTLRPSAEAPILLSPVVSAGQLQFVIDGFPGQTVVVQVSPDFVHWTPIQTNTMSGSQVNFTDPQPADFAQQFYRAVLVNP